MNLILSWKVHLCILQVRNRNRNISSRMISFLFFVACLLTSEYLILEPGVTIQYPYAYGELNRRVWGKKLKREKIWLIKRLKRIFKGYFYNGLARSNYVFWTLINTISSHSVWYLLTNKFNYYKISWYKKLDINTVWLCNMQNTLYRWAIINMIAF